MNNIRYLTPDFAVTSSLAAGDFAEAVALGFKAVINNRPDGEEGVELTGAEGARLAVSQGLHYRHLPASQLDLFTEEVVGAMAAVLSAQRGPILAHCRSGLRSAIVWAAASARMRPVEEVLGALHAAGFDLAFLRDELDKQADLARWSSAPARAACTVA